MSENSKRKSLHGEVVTYYLTPEELKAYKNRTSNKARKKPADWRWPQNRK